MAETLFSTSADRARPLLADPLSPLDPFRDLPDEPLVRSSSTPQEVFKNALKSRKFGTETELPPSKTTVSHIPTATVRKKNIYTGGHHQKKDCKSLFRLSIAAFGVIFGDIGTSPLYCYSSVFSDTPDADQIKGALCLIIWSLLLIVTVKYVMCILNADAHGEGGTFALLTLLRRDTQMPQWKQKFFTYLSFFGASMLLGDGVITPAISVLSAVEGISVYASSLEPAIVPVTIIILLILFLVQSYGTASVGGLFGPIMMSWFMCLAGIGVYNIFNAAEYSVFEALSPYYGLKMLNSFSGFELLGGVVLSVTGTEALFADLGHFGKLPIRITWLTLAFPSLILNYLGQASVLLKDPTLYSSAFYNSVPSVLHWPMVVLATMATVIASQALLTGAASLVSQAVKLNFFPRVRTVHTSKEVEGQIYIPEINYALMAAVLLVVIGFKSSAALASAYGVAVCCDMFITSIFFINIMWGLWGTPVWKICIFSFIFLIIDGAYLVANLKKVPDGGWLPLSIAASVAATMATWYYGRQRLLAAAEAESLSIEELQKTVQEKSIARASGTGIFFAAGSSSVPGVATQLLSRLHALPQRAIFMQIQVVDSPFVLPTYPYSTDLEVIYKGDGFYHVIATYGYASGKLTMESLATDTMIEILRMERSNQQNLNRSISRPFIDLQIGPKDEEPAHQQSLHEEIEDLTFYVGRDTIVPYPGANRIHRWLLKAHMFLAQNSRDFAAFYHIPTPKLIEIGFRYVERDPKLVALEKEGMTENKTSDKF